VFFGALASYGIARVNFKHSNIVLMFFLSLSMFPQLAIIPVLFIWFSRFGLLNNYFGLIIAYTGLYLPIAIWIMTAYFRTVPLEIEESARVDGCSEMRILWQIIFPLSIPGVVAAGLIVFVFTWSEFFLSMVILSKNLLRTVTVGIALYPGEYAFPWELITTATFLAMLPLLFLIFIFQKKIISGLTAGFGK